MDNKRLEIYVGWTCNQQCTYCKEAEVMSVYWRKIVDEASILKKLLKYRKLGYNHVTYLGGEPFIQPVFYFALKTGKKLGYKILVTTNCTTLHIEKQAEKFLPYIDELILSVEALSKEKQQEISRTHNFVQWEQVFENISKYWNGTLLKANIVITQRNKNDLFDLVKYLKEKGVKEMAITYPDIDYDFYGHEHIIAEIAPRYTDVFQNLIPIIDYCFQHHIRLKIPDFPFCIFPEDSRLEYIKLTDDYDYDSRLKLEANDTEIDRDVALPRERKHIKKCYPCKYKYKCWGPSKHYEVLYGLEEITPLL